MAQHNIAWLCARHFPGGVAEPLADVGIAALSATAWQGLEAAAPSLVVGARHPGCVDRRLLTGNSQCCEYDGRVTVVRFNGGFRMYARANLRECAARGGRFVTTARSRDGLRWGRMRPISIRGYAPASGDIYFFAAQANPVANTSLLALFPLSQPPAACVAVTFSLDGVRWSTPSSLRGSRLAAEGRSTDHPVANGALLRGDTVWFYTHLDVPGIHESIDDGAIGAPGAARAPPTRIVRFGVAASRLAALTESSLRLLRAAQETPHGATGSHRGRASGARPRAPGLARGD